MSVPKITLAPRVHAALRKAFFLLPHPKSSEILFPTKKLTHISAVGRFILRRLPPAKRPASVPFLSLSSRLPLQKPPMAQ